MADEPTVLELRGITKRFPGVVANDHVDFDLRQGEVHALLGENGAGKSTLMNILYGLYHPDDGRILLKGEPVRIHPAEPVHRHGTRRPVGERVQHGRVLDRGVHHRPGPEAAHGGLGGIGTAGAESHLVRAYPQFVGDRAARRVEQLAGPAALRVELAGVRPAVLLGRQQRLPGHRMRRRAGRRVEIRHAGNGNVWRPARPPAAPGPSVGAL